MIDGGCSFPFPGKGSTRGPKARRNGATELSRSTAAVRRGEQKVEILRLMSRHATRTARSRPRTPATSRRQRSIICRELVRRAPRGRPRRASGGRGASTRRRGAARGRWAGPAVVRRRQRKGDRHPRLWFALPPRRRAGPSGRSSGFDASARRPPPRRTSTPPGPPPPVRRGVPRGTLAGSRTWPARIDGRGGRGGARRGTTAGTVRGGGDTPRVVSRGTARTPEPRRRVKGSARSGPEAVKSGGVRAN